MAAGAEKTRAERIDEYVIRQAWSSIINKALFAASQLDGDEHGGRNWDIVENLPGELIASLERKLWPNGTGPESDPEYEHATTRAIVLEVSILVQLTTAEGQNYLRLEAARLAKLAADRLGEA